jgi:hypothetical protein
MIIAKKEDNEPVAYYKHHDGYRAIFGRKCDAVRMDPALARMVFKQLTMLHHEGILVMGDEERFGKADRDIREAVPGQPDR